ncbi:MAG: sulfite exporter TauE/SafE family protein [Treponema sp.]|nr:sulfite exporter TauE/SafE family protein [Treponema sp.]
MQYVIAFLEGIITFISPCLLPLLPVYVSYFAGTEQQTTGKTVVRALGFVLGFTVVFVALGALAGTLGGFLRAHQTAVNIVTGAIVVFFGLYFLGLFQLPFFRGMQPATRKKNVSFFSAFTFGIVFSISWTPCVGAFLGSALMLASQRGHAAAGIVMLLFYSLGLGIPFVISAVLIDTVKTAFAVFKQHYRIVTIVCGIFLIVVGILMMTGTIGRFLVLFG